MYTEQTPPLEARNTAYDDEISLGGVLPPKPPEPRDPGGNGPGPSYQRIRMFAPYFFAIALIVVVERVAMIFASAGSLGTPVQLVGLGVFLTIGLLLLTVGSYTFARAFYAARR